MHRRPSYDYNSSFWQLAGNTIIIVIVASISEIDIADRRNYYYAAGRHSTSLLVALVASGENDKRHVSMVCSLFKNISWHILSRRETPYVN